MANRPNHPENPSNGSSQPTQQAEFSFCPDFRRPRGGPRGRGRGRPAAESLSSVAILSRPPKRRRGVAPACRRLAISPEVFSGTSDETNRFEGLVEAGVAILATMVFGFGWAAYELDFDFEAPAPSPIFAAHYADAETGYALVAPMTPLGVAGVEDAEWTTIDGTGAGSAPDDASSAR